MIAKFFGLAGIALMMLVMAGATSMAGERAVFDQEAFAAAQKQGKSILIDISAPWCPTCSAQKPIIEKFSADARFKDLAIFDVDFDSRKDVLMMFRAQTQSTLIVFKGTQETGRSVGSTDSEAIGALLEKAL